MNEKDKKTEIKKDEKGKKKNPGDKDGETEEGTRNKEKRKKEKMKKNKKFLSFFSFFFRNGVVVRVLKNGLEVSKFKLQSCYHFRIQINTFGKGINHLIQPNMGYIVPLLFFYKDGFGFK